MEKIRDRLLEKAAQQKMPIMAALELLPVCNLSCKMCYVRKSMNYVSQNGGLMDAKQWLDFAQEAKECGLLFPLLTGGEPFLHPEFREIFSGMQKLGMQVSINSNGTMIDRETAKWLGKNVPTRMNITLYGASEETYQRLCGDGEAYGKVRNAVQWLKEKHIPVKFNASITPDNVQDLQQMVNYAKSVGSPIQIATYMFPPYRRDEKMIGRNARLSPEEAGHARAMADFFQNEPEWFLGQAARFQKFSTPAEVSNVETEPLRMQCRAGVCSLWIDWQGNMINCGMYGSVKIPLKGRTIKDAWEEMVQKTADIRYAPVCARCPNRPLCHPCIAMVHNECGDSNGKPEYMCRMNQAAAYYYQKYAKRLSDIGYTRTMQESIQNHRCELD